MKAAALWIGVQSGVLVLAALLLVSLSIPRRSRAEFIVEQVAIIVAFLLLGLLFRRRAQREGLSRGALGYYPLTRPVMVAGLVAGLLLLLIIAGVTDPIDSFLFPEGATVEEDLYRGIRAGGVIGATLLLPSNSILTPIVEEYAWRGYVQVRLMEGLGVRTGLTLTAVVFAAKHLIVDVSLFRVTTLLVASFALGLIRLRWGTTVTTIAHIVMNLAATAFGTVEAFTGDSK